ncbi:hypothetical protein CEV33_1481 [Brucella grignonensis]|uniref:Uncharacterized protein n=1 Tax=Brucella grignonensis TaxID=94627 RepID=A0A256FAS5_9HYPH|nr:hypothetical protein CEV33_1481 [Brucella grignonensis]
MRLIADRMSLPLERIPKSAKRFSDKIRVMKSSAARLAHCEQCETAGR